MASREQLLEVFQDTERWYQENAKLAEAVKKSIAGTALYGPADYPPLPPAKGGTAAVYCSPRSSRNYDVFQQVLG